MISAAAKGDVKTAAQLVSQDETVELSDYFLRSATKAAGKRQVVPKSLHQRTPLFIGSKADVAFASEILSTESVPA